MIAVFKSLGLPESVSLHYFCFHDHKSYVPDSILDIAGDILKKVCIMLLFLR